MYHHGPTCLDGPVSRSRLWWQFTAPEAPDGVRQDRIERIKRQIAEGTYDTPERWEAALDRLLDEMEQA